jgi:hypothetical protein
LLVVGGKVWSKACKEMAENEKFLTLHFVALELGNFINHGTARGNATAIKFESLEKLSSTKCNSSDFKDLLQLLVHQCILTCPEVLTVSSEFEASKKSVTIPLSMIATRLKDLDKLAEVGDGWMAFVA